MTADDFVNAVDKSVRQAAVSSTIENLTDPPGIQPDSELIALSKWFSALPLKERELVEQTIQLAASHALFGFLAVLDGARSIEAPPDKGHLELYHVKGDLRILLNDPALEPLNDKL